MYIELLGLSGVRIQSNDKIILLSPPDDSSELRANRLKADIVVTPAKAETINITPSGENAKLFIISNPGEYEAQGVFFYCLPNRLAANKPSLLTSLTIEDVVIAHLANLHRVLTNAELELFEGTDILLIPVGGQNVLAAKAAGELVNAIEPRIVIPMHFAQAGLPTKYDDPTGFLKIVGGKIEPQAKVKITKKDLPPEGMTVVYLQP